jgi:hypothetical protein
LQPKVFIIQMNFDTQGKMSAKAGGSSPKRHQE